LFEGGRRWLLDAGDWLLVAGGTNLHFSKKNKPYAKNALSWIAKPA